MKYWPPYGATDPDAPWVNGNPAAALRGSILDGRAIEHTQREITGFVTDAGLTPAEANLHQLTQAVQSGKVIFGLDEGEQNAIVVSLPRAPAAYAAGFTVRVLLAFDITSAATINVSGLGVKSIVKPDGTPLGQGSGFADHLIDLTYNGTKFELMSSGGGGGISNTLIQAAGVMPEIFTGGNLFTSTNTTGQIVIDLLQTWVWRGLVMFSTSTFSSGERTFATLANKTYHLRWHAPGTGTATPQSTYPNGRFVLKDLADTGYNPSTYDERNGTFDTKIDDMLIGRVVTNGSNALTVTMLRNRRLLFGNVSYQLNTTRTTDGSGNFCFPMTAFPLNWARSPTVAGALVMTEGSVSSAGREIKTILGGGEVTPTASDGTGTEHSEGSRYTVKPLGVLITGNASASLTLQANGTMLFAAA